MDESLVLYASEDERREAFQIVQINGLTEIVL